MIQKFKLGAVEWTIKIDNHEMDLRTSYGLSDFHVSEITLQDKSEGKDRKLEAIEQTLYHEVTHSILDTMGRGDLSADELFVQQFSLLLHQFEKTKE